MARGVGRATWFVRYTEIVRVRRHVRLGQIETELKRQEVRKNPTRADPVRVQVRVESIPVEIEWDEEAAKWVTHVPLLNGISTFGDTQTEALQRTKALMFDYIETMAQDGLPLPFTKAELRQVLAALKRS